MLDTNYNVVKRWYPSCSIEYKRTTKMKRTIKTNYSKSTKRCINMQ